MPIGKDSIIENVYKKNINGFIWTIKILSLTDMFFLTNIIFEEY